MHVSVFLVSFTESAEAAAVIRVLPAVLSPQRLEDLSDPHSHIRQESSSDERPCQKPRFIATAFDPM
jgi:hypothetical protein